MNAATIRRRIIRFTNVLPIALLTMATVALGVYVGGQELGAAYLGDLHRGGGGDVMDVRPEVTQSPSALMAKHDCWTGEAPADVEIPGHVVTDQGYGGSRMVHKALQQIFEGEDHGLTIYAFCR